MYISYKLNLKNNKASGLILFIIITFIMASYTQYYATIIWQQQKILNLENSQLKLNKLKNNLLQQSLDSLVNYKKLANIPKNYQINMQNSIAIITNIIDNNKLAKYNIYRIDLLLDDPYVMPITSSTRPGRAGELHIYVAVCEDDRIYNNLDQISQISQISQINQIRIVPISNII